MASFKIYPRLDNLASGTVVLQIWSEETVNGVEAPRLDCEHVFTEKVARKLSEKFAESCDAILQARANARGEDEIENLDEKDLEGI